MHKMKKLFADIARRVAFFLYRHGLGGEAHYIGGSTALPPPLTPEEERAAIALHMQGISEARDRLIEHNLRLVVYIAQKFDNTGIGLEDLISIGTIGLIKAVNTFDADKKNKLATYASRCIENEILMYLRKTVKTRREISLDEPLNTDREGNELLLSDILGTDGDSVYRNLEDDADRTLLRAAMQRLSSREREIMTLRYGIGSGEELTQKEVADILGISQSYISRLEKKILKQLRADIAKMS